jgi:hypothetical protein
MQCQLNQELRVLLRLPKSSKAYASVSPSLAAFGRIAGRGLRPAARIFSAANLFPCSSAMDCAAFVKVEPFKLFPVYAEHPPRVLVSGSAAIPRSAQCHSADISGRCS